MLKLDAGEFPTKVLNVMRVEYMVFAETFYEPGQIVEQHSHNHSGFVALLNGNFVEIHEGRDYNAALMRGIGQLWGGLLCLVVVH